MIGKIRNQIRSFSLGMKSKLIYSLSAIAAMLLISSVITFMEYSRMSHYVSDLIADNISSINLSDKLSDISSAYNYELMTALADTSVVDFPIFDKEEFEAHCDSLSLTLTSDTMKSLADSLVSSYSDFMLASNELAGCTCDAPSYYYNTKLRPLYDKLRGNIRQLNVGIYNELNKNSATFDRGFYRSVVPGVVAVGFGLLLILLLMYFIIVYYANPIYKMLRGLDAYRSYNNKYSYEFEGDDQLAELNDGIIELVNENRQLRRRLSSLKERCKKMEERNNELEAQSEKMEDKA